MTTPELKTDFSNMTRPDLIAKLQEIAKTFRAGKPEAALVALSNFSRIPHAKFEDLCAADRLALELFSDRAKDEEVGTVLVSISEAAAAKATSMNRVDAPSLDSPSSI